MFSLFRRVLPRLVALPAAGWALPKAQARAVVRKRSPALASNIAAVVLCTIVTVAFAGGFGQLVFDGALAPYMHRGIFAALVSTIVVLVILPWRGAFPFSVGGPDSNPSAVLAVTLAGIAQAMPGAGSVGSAALLPTVLAFVAVSAAGCGVVVWLLGITCGGRCVRYIPYPVVGGFLAGSGYLLVAGACKMLTGAPLGFASFGALGQVNVFAGGTTVVVATLLVVMTRRLRHHLVVPTIIVAAVLGFHVVRVLVGIDLETARGQGLLVPRLEPGMWLGVASVSWTEVRWDLLLPYANDIAAMTAVVVVAALLNTTSIELASGRDADADRELRAIGVSNMLAGLLGGMVASNSFNRTILNFRAGATSPWVAWSCAAAIAGVMLFAPGAVGLLPRPVLTGLILYLGITLLLTWVVEARRTLTTLDHAVVLAILGVVATLGIVTGVVLGVFIACVSFAVTMSRNGNVRQAFNAESVRSNVERPAHQLAELRAQGGRLRGFVLDGVLFFGTATHLLEGIRRSLTQTRVVLLDFRLIQGIDGSAIIVMKRVHALCRDAPAHLVLTGLSSRFEAQLARGGFDFGAAHVKRFADLDRGLEWGEELILGEGNTRAPMLADALGAALSPEGSRRLLAACERRSIAAGEALVRQGDASTELFFIERGRVHVLLPLAADGHESSKRLRTYGSGTVVGEMGFYSGEPRSADIVAEADTEALCLTRAQLDAIEQTQPELARAFHRYIILTLAQRLRAANEEIRELL